MSRRTWTIAVSLAVPLFLATPVWAPPPCSSMATTSQCQMACLSTGLGSCGTVSQSGCVIFYNCTAGNIALACECDGAGGGGCFLAGTRITMADRTTKPIEEIAVGDVVLAYDKASGEMKPDPVKRLHATVTVDSYLLVNDHLRITKTQPVLSAGRWVEMGQLGVGDTLTGADGRAVPIETLVVVDTPITVYNFDTNPFETFVAEGFIVHRKQETTEP